MTGRASTRSPAKDFITPFDGSKEEGAPASVEAHIMKAWTQALQEMMGYPLDRSGARHVVFICGRFDSVLPIDKVEKLARRFEHDIVYLKFADSVREGPANVVFAAVDRDKVRIFENCEAWVLKSWHKVELVAQSHRIQVVGDRIKLKPNNLDEMRARRVQLTRNTWRELAVVRSKDDLTNWKSVPEDPNAPLITSAASRVEEPPTPREANAPEAGE